MNKILTTLSDRHRLFVEAYNGDPAEAAGIAGYTGAPAYLKSKGEELLLQPLILEAIKVRSQNTAKTFRVIASREERQEFWTSIMKNEDPYIKERKDPNTNAPLEPEPIPISQRLKATELLGKSEADFTENINSKVEHSLSDIIMKSYGTGTTQDLTIGEIEAEYRRLKDTGKSPVIEVKAIESAPILEVEDLI